MVSFPVELSNFDTEYAQKFRNFNRFSYQDRESNPRQPINDGTYRGSSASFPSIPIMSLFSSIRVFLWTSILFIINLRTLQFLIVGKIIE